MKNSKPFCIRCLIRELNNDDALLSIDKYKGSLNPSIICEEKLYESRLLLCKDCKWLNMGTCYKSGSYVEARAYNINNHCPLGEKIW